MILQHDYKGTAIFIHMVCINMIGIHMKWQSMS